MSLNKNKNENGPEIKSNYGKNSILSNENRNASQK